MTLDDFELL